MCRRRYSVSTLRSEDGIIMYNYISLVSDGFLDKYFANCKQYGDTWELVSVCLPLCLSVFPLYAPPHPPPNSQYFSFSSVPTHSRLFVFLSLMSIVLYAVLQRDNEDHIAPTPAGTKCNRGVSRAFSFMTLLFMIHKKEVLNTRSHTELAIEFE